MKDAMQFIVDGCNGVYTYHSLVTRYPVYIGRDKELLSIWIDTHMEFAGETINSVCDPNNFNWCENVGYLEQYGMYVMDDDGLFWRVESIEGDLFAIHPDAVWNEEEDSYTFEKE